MLLSLRVRDLLLASWETERERIAHTLPPGLEPVEVDGSHLVTLTALRYEGGRLGRLPVPPFSQLNARAYVSYRGEPAVFFLLARVTVFGMGGAFFGAPYRPARLRFQAGRAEAPGLGVRIRYRLEGPTEPGQLARHELGLFEAAGLRGFRIRRGSAAWRRAVPTEPLHVEPLLALGFDLAGPPSLLYAERASFELDLPPSRFR